MIDPKNLFASYRYLPSSATLYSRCIAVISRFLCIDVVRGRMYINAYVTKYRMLLNIEIVTKMTSFASLRACSKYSIGMQFDCFLGSRRGYPLPTTVHVSTSARRSR